MTPELPSLPEPAFYVAPRVIDWFNKRKNHKTAQMETLMVHRPDAEFTAGMVTAADARTYGDARAEHARRADARDAERYRWLRNAEMNERNRLEHYASESLDAAIDAAIRALAREAKP